MSFIGKITYPLGTKRNYGRVQKIVVYGNGIDVECENGRIGGHGTSTCCDGWSKGTVSRDVYREIADQLKISRKAEFLEKDELVGRKLVSFGIIDCNKSLSSKNSNCYDTIFVIVTRAHYFMTCFQYNSVGCYSGRFILDDNDSESDSDDSSYLSSDSDSD